MTGHVVIRPSASPHRALRLVMDVDLLLAATIASVRMYRPVIVFEPAGSRGVVPAVPANLSEGQEEHRGGGWDREVDGVGGGP